jgi:hypothetical protein
MAVDTYYYSTQCTAGSGRSPRAGLGITSITGTYSLPATNDLDTNDCIKMVNIPAGATILDVIVDIPSGGLDTSTGVSWTLGDTDATDDLDRYITTSTVGRSSAGGIVRMNNAAGHGYKFAADGTIDITISAGASTNTTTGDIIVTVFYTMDA